ncbi:MAG: hypothetical protein CR981_03785 [Proteobacteria bacterium]|nr:MAG: hypothetical protein CR981_03785 [Pseudomonadota bacterium]
MELFIARQPIFTVNLRVFAYELLYRGSSSFSLTDNESDRATANVLSSTFLTEGIDRISNNKPCFINFTRNLLLKKLPATFPSSQVIIEVLEDVPPTPDVIAVCKELKHAGYTIALDDFIFDPKLLPLVEIADIIKFDCLLSPIETLLPTLKKLEPYKLKYLAEKVETHEMFEKAKRFGFSYFQGYFFRKPEQIGIREVSTAKANLVNLLTEVNRSATTLKELEQIISRDVGLTYKLLRYINSSYFYRLHKIESIKHAIAYLGTRDLKKFITLVIISELATDKPSELVRTALIRARFLEILATEAGEPENAEKLFLLGLFSLLDAILGMKMEYISGRLPLGEELKQALISRKGRLGSFFNVLLNYEDHDRNGCIDALQIIDVQPARIGPMYLEAITFSQSILA